MTLVGRDDKSIIIVRDDFTHAINFQYESNLHDPIISLIRNSSGNTLTYLQFTGRGYIFKYSRNPFYYFKYPFYGFIFLLVFLFIYLIYYLQRYRLNLKLETEKKMVSLQMKAIKNQIDPHFTLNVINAIGSLYSEEKDKSKADFIFGKYARLIRQTVISSDQTQVLIEEELDFIRNYIEIERFRHGNSFDYSINIHEGSKTKIRIPRMLVHTFVENAIKHGISSREKGGILRIEVMPAYDHIKIIIEDNGLYLGKNLNSGYNTGKGFHILDDLLDLNYRLEGIRITWNLERVPDEGNDSAYTRVTINIPVKDSREG